MRDTAVDLCGEGDAGAVEWKDGAGSGDGLREAEGGLSGWRGVGAEAVEVEAVERVGFGVEVEDGGDLDGRGLRVGGGRSHDYDDGLVGLLVGGEVGSCAPGEVGAGDGVHVEGEAALAGEVFVLDEGQAGGKAVLWSEAAEGDVQWLAGDQGLADVDEVAEGEVGAGLHELLLAGMQVEPLSAKVGVEAAFVAFLRQRVRDQEGGEKSGG